VSSATLDPTPFREWFNQQLLAGLHRENLASQMGIDIRQLHRWRVENVTLDRASVEAALHRIDVPFWEVYGLDTDDTELEAEKYCGRCHDNVQPVDGVCPWCESTLADARARMWCEHEDRLVYPADDGSCWRCGRAVQPIPWQACECGCGTEVPCFDPQGRRRGFVLGHAPRSREDTRQIDVEPFARYLEAELAALDPISALARKLSISRDDITAALKRTVPTVDRQVAQKALWAAGRADAGKGVAPINRTTFADLYPDEVRKKVCPGCGQGKAPHAELCKRCRRKAGGYKKPPTSKCQIRPELLEEAFAMHATGTSWPKVARAIFDRLPHRNVEAVTQALRREYARRETAPA